MAGSAVVTINRSRLNMNSAAEVSANVQPVLARALRALRSGGRGAASTRLPSARRTRTSLGRAPGSNPGDEWAQLTCRGRRELPAAADTELPVDVAEVPLDVLDGHEQCVGDVRVALAGGGELGHATFAKREPATGVGEDRGSPARQP